MAESRPWYQRLFGRERGISPSRVLELSAAPSPLPIDPASVPPIPPGGKTQEHGVAGTELYGGTIAGEEYNRELEGQKGRDIFDKMRRTDAQVRATLQVMKLPLHAAQWAAIPPENGDEIDQAIADFVNSCLIDDDAMVDSWQFVLRHILLQLDFGFSMLEKVWRVDKEGYYRLQRLAPRLPKTIHAWHLRRDGSIFRVWQWAPVIKEVQEDPSQKPKFPPPTTFEYIPIPGHALCVFTLDREGDNYEGISALRASYRNYYYKDLIYHLDGVRLDRYGVGIPVAELEDNHNLNEADMERLESVLKDLRSNERVYLIAPPNVRYRILAPEGQGGAVAGATTMIEHHDQMISRNVLAGFMTMGNAPLGQATFGSRMTDLFISSLYGLAANIAADLKRTVIKPLCDLNFDMTRREYPSVVVRDLETKDIEGMMKTVLEAAGTLITPDDDLEQMLRKALKLPPLPKELSRRYQQEQQERQAQMQQQAAGAMPDPAAGVEQGPLEEPAGLFEVVPTGDPQLPWGVHEKATGKTIGRYATEQEAQTAAAEKMRPPVRGTPPV